MVPHCAFLETVPLTQAQKLTKLLQEHPREKLPAGIFGISYRLIVSGSLHNFMVSKKKKYITSLKNMNQELLERGQCLLVITPTQRKFCASVGSARMLYISAERAVNGQNRTKQ